MPSTQKTAETGRASATDGRASARQTTDMDALQLLRADHHTVDRLLTEYEGQRSPAGKRAVAQQICAELTVHMQIEEDIFYPACRELKDVGDLLAEAKVEHQSLKLLIAKIEGGEPGGEEYDAEVTVLGEYVKHHVEEEHDELFPMVKESQLDLQTLGRQMAKRKAELQAMAQ